MTNTYLTGNPLGSTAAKDLSDNSSNFDDAINSPLPAFYDRFLKRRQTVAGFEAMAADVIASLGFEVTHLVYVDGSPLTVSRPTQLIDYDGLSYKVQQPAVFPVTLSGTWATDSLLLSDVSESSLRQELASADGAQGIGGGVVSVDGYPAIRLLLKTSPAKTALFFGQEYALDPADSSSAEALPYIVVAADGGRWKLKTDFPTDVRQFGAIGNGLANDSPAFQKIADIGGTHSIRDGIYRLADMVTSTYAEVGFPEVGYPSRRLSLLGNSSGNTLFRNDVQTGSKVAFKLEGTVPGSGSQGVHGQDRIGHFAMIRQGAPWPTGQTGVGIWVLNKSMFHIEDIHLQFLDIGVELDGCLSSTMNNMRLLNGGCGLFVNGTANSQPNALTFNALMASGNNRQGVLCNQLGAGNVFIGGSIEHNGTHGVAGQGGFVANLIGANGTACLTMMGVYFEGNGGQADIFLDNVSSLNVSVVLINCTFNRVSASKFVTSCIDARSSGGGKLKVTLSGCSFLSTGDYVPSPTRPFVFTDGNVEILGWDTCTYSESTSIPAYMTSASSVVSGSVNAAGAMAGGIPGVTVTRVSAGIYNIDKSGGWGPFIDSYHVSVTPYGPEARIESVTKQSTTRIQAVFRSHTVASNVDVAFSFAVSRTQ